ncbi:MAG: EF-hand domain-containing protein, partial [Verrucomicrobiae bacterium]|nr:EF-hand domain-containing protein [Verrucomicrobiae bacterium]
MAHPVLRKPLSNFRPLPWRLALAWGIALFTGFADEATHRAADEAFHRADKDGDGKVTPAELPQRALFRRFDGNGDGVITLDETRAAFGQVPGQGRPAESAVAELKGLKGTVESL